MSNHLERILEHKRREVAKQRHVRPPSALQAELADAAPARGFTRALRDTIERGHAAVIAELKQASPSKGLLCADYRPAELAHSYAEAGACCLSVLTDTHFFRGGAEHLRAARAATRLPVLRKDFIIDPYQVDESRCMGADCILLIVAALDDAALQRCEQRAGELGMDVLVEVHDDAELERALRLDTPLIGINNRDLHSFTTDIRTTQQLAPRLPPGRIAVSESGIHAPQQLAELRRGGVHAFLIGEALVSAADPGACLRRLVAA